MFEKKKTWKGGCKSVENAPSPERRASIRGGGGSTTIKNTGAGTKRLQTNDQK